MNRRTFLSTLASLPIVGRLLPQQLSPEEPIGVARRFVKHWPVIEPFRGPMAVYADGRIEPWPKWTDEDTARVYWQLRDAGCDEGGVKFNLNLPADYNPPRPKHVAHVADRLA